MWTNSHVKTAFWGTSIELIALGSTSFRLPLYNETFNVSRPNINIHNIIMGQMYLEHVGNMTVTRYVEKNDGRKRICPDKIIVNFKKGSWSGSGKFMFEATFKADGDQYKIHGKWNEAMYLENMTAGTKKLIWSPMPRPKDNEYLYSFTRFAL